MNKFLTATEKFLADEEGLTTVEYAIAGGLVGAAVIVAFRELGTAVGGVITGITDEISGFGAAAGGGGGS